MDHRFDLIGKCRLSFFYRKDGRIRGMITTKHKADTGMIGLIAVHPSCQGSGIGKRLIYRVIAFCREKQLAELDVITQILNKSACRFYEKIGFRI